MTKIETLTATELGTMGAKIAGSHIKDLIDRELLSFEIATGKKAHSIYLGHEEWRAFEAFGKQVSTIPIIRIDKGVPEGYRIEYCGRRVYEIISERHLNVGL